jgi:hypothetical protein
MTSKPLAEESKIEETIKKQTERSIHGTGLH